jgi:septum formation protein
MRHLILASSSPRRRQLLTEHAIAHEALSPPIDDGELHPGDTNPTGWVVALAHLKARSVADTIDNTNALVLGCDTVVVKGEEIIGQPEDQQHAEQIINRLSGGAHIVITGVAIIDPQTGDRTHLVDSARVTVGALHRASIAEYLQSGHWRGKAGAYNLMDRIGAGWPIEYAGDPTTVMGLPMRRLAPLLRQLGADAPERV